MVARRRDAAPLDGPASTGELGRDIILAAAQQCFYRQGYHGTTVRQIAEVADVTATALYYYYDSKQALLADLMDRFMTWALHETKVAVAEAGGPRDRLVAAIRSHVLVHTRFAPASFVVNSELRSLEAEHRAHHVAQRDDLQHIFDLAVLSGVRKGVFSVEHPREASRAVVAMCTGVASWYRLDGPVRPEAMADRYVGYSLALLGTA